LQANTVENYSEYKIKRLAGTQRQELEDRRKPTEIASVQLVELEGDIAHCESAKNIEDPPSSPPTPFKGNEQVSYTPEAPVASTLRQTGRRPSYRFEEYAVSPDTASPGNLRFSPISDIVPSLHASDQRSVRQPSDRDEEYRSLDNDAIFPVNVGVGEPYTLFRWPDDSGANPFR